VLNVIACEVHRSKRFATDQPLELTGAANIVEFKAEVLQFGELFHTLQRCKVTVVKLQDSDIREVLR